MTFFREWFRGACVLAVAVGVLATGSALASETCETGAACCAKAACDASGGLATQTQPGLAAVAISGSYQEARTCDVWTGPCFSNAEINLSGDHAVLAWIVDQGSWRGVALDGQRIVAAVDSQGTLGTNAEGKTRATVFVDPKASDQQVEALIAMAKELAPSYLADVVAVRRETIEYTHAEASAELSVGKVVRVKTAALSWHCDAHCGNEEKAYPSLGLTVVSECAKTLANRYAGEDLGVTWSHPGARSAMRGRFELAAEVKA
jgi:hypothetical protein